MDSPLSAGDILASGMIFQLHVMDSSVELEVLASEVKRIFQLHVMDSSPTQPPELEELQDFQLHVMDSFS